MDSVSFILPLVSTSVTPRAENAADCDFEPSAAATAFLFNLANADVNSSEATPDKSAAYLNADNDSVLIPIEVAAFDNSSAESIEFLTITAKPTAAAPAPAAIPRNAFLVDAANAATRLSARAASVSNAPVRNSKSTTMDPAVAITLSIQML